MSEPPILEQITTTLQRLPDELAALTQRLQVLEEQHAQLTLRQHETIVALTTALEQRTAPSPPPVRVPEVVPALPVRGRQDVWVQGGARRGRSWAWWMERGGIALVACAVGMGLLWVGQAEPPYARFAAEVDQVVMRDSAGWPRAVQQALRGAYQRAGVQAPSERSRP